MVNGRLAGIYFREKYGIYGHVYIKRGDYSKREHKMIDTDVKKFQFVYRNKSYFDKILKQNFKITDHRKLFPKTARLKRLL